MIDTTGEKMGKVFGCCELGGAGMMKPETVAVAETGIRNLMIHLGIMKGRPRTSTWRGRRETRFLEALSFNRYVHAPVSGIFEPFVDLADRVEKGQPVGQIHDLDMPGGRTTVCRAAASGMVYARHAFGLIEQDRLVALVAHEAAERWGRRADRRQG